ncbi:hypothetical protein [Cellulomonas endophytica]|uniref:hypothetical protein n=1 Tax=Cellulomonas endophytica TaxID=2494735 RepID=UPI0010113310|nr:hypothetical protein [Cellulomonas endophytica]
MFVLTIDQKGSRRKGDRVDGLLADLADVPAVLPFERTVGDEVQAVLDDPAVVVATALRVLRAGGWSVGIGAGPVDPLAGTSRASSGEAFVLARDAVTAAKSRARAVPVAVRGADTTAAGDAEAVLVLAAAVRARRSDAGWQAVDAFAADRRPGQEVVAARLGVTQQAVSQRLRAALAAEEEAVHPVVARLLARAEQPSSTTATS